MPQYVNHVGTAGREFPLERDDSVFTILVTGGSVAAQIVWNNTLEDALNGRLKIGKPIRVLSGASGAWRQPQQTIFLTLYGDVADAVISLDGFNEHWAVKPERLTRLEVPDGDFYTCNPVLDGGYDRLGASWACGKLRQLSQRHEFAGRVLHHANAAN